MKPPIVPIKHITHTNYEYKCDAKQLRAMIDYCLSKRYWFAVQSDTDVDGKAFSWFKCGLAPEGFRKRKIKLAVGGSARHATDRSQLVSGSR